MDGCNRRANPFYFSSSLILCVTSCCMKDSFWKKSGIWQTWLIFIIFWLSSWLSLRHNKNNECSFEIFICPLLTVKWSYSPLLCPVSRVSITIEDFSIPCFFKNVIDNSQNTYYFYKRALFIKIDICYYIFSYFIVGMMGEWNVKREMCFLSQSLEVVYEQIGVSWLWIQSDNIRGKFIAVRGFWSQSFNGYEKGKK